MLEESSIIFKIRLIAPFPTKESDLGTDKWFSRIKASTNKIKKGAGKPITEFKGFIKQKAQRDSTTEAEVLANPVLSDMLKGLRLYRKKVKRAQIKNEAGVSKFDAGLDKAKGKYDKMSRERNYPLFGSAKEGVKGLVFLGMMGLCADGRLMQYLSAKGGSASGGKPDIDEIVEGNSLIICLPEKLKAFRKELRWRIAESGAVIIKANYDRQTLNIQNEILNHLVNRYQLDEFAQFEPSGASHIDFIVVEMPDPANPAVTIKRLGLDIQVSRKLPCP